jgi:hypothetical protein
MAWYFLFFYLHFLKSKKHPKKIPCYKRYKNSRNFLEEKAKYQVWITMDYKEEAKI